MTTYLPSSTPPQLSPTKQPELRVLLTTTSGRYIFHYPTTEDSSEPSSLLTTLAAAFTAFTHTTHSTVRTIQTSQQTLCMASSPPLLLAITTPTTTSTPPLTPLSQLLISAVYTATSRSLHDHLLYNPTAPTGKIAALVGPLLRSVVTYFSRHPFPVYLSLSPSQPLPIPMFDKERLQDMMRDLIKPKPELTHALLMAKTGNDTGMGKILMDAFREGMRLSWLDHLLLSCADEDRLFLPTTGFRRGLRVRRRSLKSVTAPNLEVRPANLGTCTLLVLGTWSPEDNKSAESALDDLEDLLSDSGALDSIHTAVHHIHTILERVRVDATDFYSPFTIDRPDREGLKALLMLDSTHCIGTDRAYDPLIAAPIAKAISLARTSKERITCVSSGVRVLVEDARYVVVFEESVPHEEAEISALEAVQRMKNFQRRLMPLDVGLCVPHNTPLAGFLAPFTS